MIDLARLGGPFDLVLDVGGNIGDFADLASHAWPSAHVVSFEPVPVLAAASAERADGRWSVIPVAISADQGVATIYHCTNQHSASTMQEPGTVRRRHFGIVDDYRPIEVDTAALDDYRGLCADRKSILIKIDVEGHEGAVIDGGYDVLLLASVVVVEIQADPDIFLDSPPPQWVDEHLRGVGLVFDNVAGVQLSPTGQVLQYDAVYRRSQSDA